MPSMLPENIFAGKVAIITGGGTGIGFAIAQNLAALGAKIVIASRRPEVIEKAAEVLRAQGTEAIAVPVDVREPKQVISMVDVAKAHFGHIDMLINSAAGNFRVKAEDISVNAWRAVTRIVLDGTWFCTQAVGREMIAGDGGAILNIGTIGAFHGSPLAVHSASAKAGLLAMTRTLAVEWGPHNIRVNVLTPGGTADTGAVGQLFPTEEDRQRVVGDIPLGRLAARNEVANAAVFLLSEYASYVTGENFIMDGGKWLGRGHLASSPSVASKQ